MNAATRSPSNKSLHVYLSPHLIIVLKQNPLKYLYFPHRFVPSGVIITPDVMSLSADRLTQYFFPFPQQTKQQSTLF